MQAKQSSTASEMYDCSEPLTPAVPSAGALASAQAGSGSDRSPIPKSLLGLPAHRASSCPAMVDGEGLLHDARNLIGALGLYCDLLSMPGVLKMEHRHYAEEVRHLGARSAAMIQQLMENSVKAQGAAACSWLSKSPRPCDADPAAVTEATPPGLGAMKPTGNLANPVGLRSIVERCSGLLGRGRLRQADRDQLRSCCYCSSASGRGSGGTDSGQSGAQLGGGAGPARSGGRLWRRSSRRRCPELDRVPALLRGRICRRPNRR